MFTEFFGSDLIVVPGPEVASRMNSFFTWYTHRVLEEDALDFFTARSPWA